MACFWFSKNSLKQGERLEATLTGSYIWVLFATLIASAYISRRSRAMHRTLCQKKLGCSPGAAFCGCSSAAPGCRASLLHGVALHPVPLPWPDTSSGLPTSRPAAANQTFTGSQQAKCMFSADQICVLNRAGKPVNTKWRLGSIFCEVFPSTHFLWCNLF